MRRTMSALAVLAAAALLARLGYPVHPADPTPWLSWASQAATLPRVDASCPFCRTPRPARVAPQVLGCEGCTRSWVP